MIYSLILLVSMLLYVVLIFRMRRAWIRTPYNQPEDHEIPVTIIVVFRNEAENIEALLNDLDQRGLLEETLVVWVGEFGRTPKINKSISRDHWPKCYTALLAGGGIQGGSVYGTSDRYGAVPDRDPVTVGDLAATVYSALGIDHTMEVHDNLNRPLPIAKGTPVSSIFA